MADEAVKTLAVKIALDDGSFRDGMASLKRQMQEADSGFKASVSGIKNWGNSVDGLKSNAQALGEKISLQKQIVEQYESALNKSKTALEQNSQKMMDNKSKLDSAKQAYEESASSIGKNVDETQNLKKEMDAAQADYDKSEKLVRNNNKAVEGYSIQLNDAKGKLTAMQTALDETNTKLNNHSIQWDNLSKKLSGIGSSFTSAGKKLSDIGASLSTKISLPLVAVGAAAVKTGDDFEAQMSRVSAISGATGNDLKTLNNQALQLGQDTAFSATEAAEGMENLASAGFSTKEIMSAMPGMLDLAASSGEDLASSSDIAASTLRGFGLAADQAGHVADVLAKNAANTNAAVADTGEAMKYVAPVAQNAGWSLEQVTAAIGEMADAGIKGEQAGTTLRGALTSLMNPSKEQAEAMKAIGFSAYDAQGKMKPLSQMIGELQSGTKNLTGEQRDNAIATIMGTNALSGMQVLIKDGSGNLDKLTSSLKSSDGAAKQMANTMQGNTKGAIEQMKGSLETAAIKIQQAVAPSITRAANVIQDLANKFASLSPAQQDAILKLGLVAIAVGPVITAIGKLSTGIGGAFDAFSRFSKSMSAGQGVATALTKMLTPAGLVIIAITAIAALAFVIIKNWGPISTFFKNIWSGIQTGASTVGNGIKGAFDGAKQGIQSAWSSAGSWFSGIGQNIQNGFNTTINWIKENWKSLALFLVNPIAGAVSLLYNNNPQFKAWADSLIQTIKTAFVNVKNFIVAPFQQAFEWVKVQWLMQTTFVDSFLNTLKNSILSIWEPIKNGLLQAWNGIKTVAQGAWELIKNVVMAPILLLIDLVTGDFGKMGSDLSSIWNNIQTAAGTIWNGLTQIFAGVWNAISGAATAFWTLFMNGLTIIWNSIVNTAKTVWNGLMTFLSNLWTSIRTNAENTWNSVATFFTGLWQKITAGITSTWNSITQFFTTTWNNIKNGVTTTWNNIANFLRNPSILFNAIQNGFNTAINWLKSLPAQAMQWASDLINKYAGPLKNPALISDSIHGAMDSAIDWIKNLPHEALEWGKDLIQSFVDGIKAKFEAVQDAIKGVGNKIRSMLHFTEPDEGPLADFHTWMPDMMEGLASGINENKYKVLDAMRSLAADMSINPQLQMAYAGGHSAASGAAESEGEKLSFVQNNYSPKALGNAEVARQTRNLFRQASITARRHRQ